MQDTAIEVHDLCKAYDGQPRCPLLGAQLQTFPDRLRVALSELGYRAAGGW